MMPSPMTLLYSTSTTGTQSFQVTHRCLFMNICCIACKNQVCNSIQSEYEKTRRMSGSDFLSNVGGLCGLCLGFSLMSGVEILYWIVIRIVRNVLLQI